MLLSPETSAILDMLVENGFLEFKSGASFSPSTELSMAVFLREQENVQHETQCPRLEPEGALGVEAVSVSCSDIAQPSDVEQTMLTFPEEAIEPKIAAVANSRRLPVPTSLPHRRTRSMVGPTSPISDVGFSSLLVVSLLYSL